MAGKKKQSAASKQAMATVKSVGAFAKEVGVTQPMARGKVSVGKKKPK